MRDKEIFWKRVQLALDERHDPREDEAVQELIATAPERYGELQSMLDALERLPRATQRRPMRRVAVLAAASAFVLLGIAWFALRANRSPLSLPATRERVLSLEWEVSSESPTRSTSIVVDDRGLTARAEYRDNLLSSTIWTTLATQANYP